MKPQMTPQPMHLVDQYDDGEDSRHYSFQLATPHLDENIKPGQFFTLTLPGHGEAAFTYLTLPDHQGRFQALIRKTGSLTNRLFSCETGTLLGYRGPFGSGVWPVKPLKGRRVLFLAGGIGLPPLATVIDQLLAADTPIGLIYGSRNRASQVLRHERERWQQQMPIIETFDQPAAVERAGTPLDHLDTIAQEMDGEPEAVLTCGPEVMMSAVGNFFTDRGVSTESIWLALERRMHCGIGLCGHCYFGSSYVCTDGPVYRWADFLKQQKMLGD